MLNDTEYDNNYAFENRNVIFAYFQNNIKNDDHFHLPIFVGTL